jgi:murein peptide amidase A
VTDREFERHQVAEGRPRSVALLAASVSVATVAVFLFTMGGPPTRGWVPQAQNASSSVRESVSTVHDKSDTDAEATGRSPIRPSRTDHAVQAEHLSHGPTAGSNAASDIAEKTEPVVRSVSSIETVVGYSVKERPIVCRRLGDGQYVVLMMASIHGNEAAGTPLLNDLAEHVVANSEILDGVTLVLMPVVNPDGVESGKRYNARGVDLNRNFPAENRQNSSRYGLNALSEPEALAIYQVINDTLPNHIVTLHEPMQCVDYDGPAKALATVMSEFCPLPVEKLGSRPGSLGSYAGVTLGIPTITFELPPNAAGQSPKFLWRFYGEALTQAVLYRHATTE